MLVVLKEYKILVFATLQFLICDTHKTDSILSPSMLAKLNYDTLFYTGTYIDRHSLTNVTTQIGTHAYLPCKAKQLGNKSVSWVRVRDDHILTVDRITFIADDRFQAFHVESSGLWTLQIKYVQGRDAGIYECQVSTEPKISARVNLQVIVPRTELIGESERFVKAGSTVVLQCVIRGALEPPSFIIWYYGSQQLYTENQNGWQIQIDRAKFDVDSDAHSAVGSLIIESAKKKDSGNYTCSPSNSPPVTIALHVLNAHQAEIIGEPDPFFKSKAVITLHINLFLFHTSFILLLVTEIHRKL